MEFGQRTAEAPIISGMVLLAPPHRFGLSLNFFLELLAIRAFCESTRKSWTGDCYTLI